jgi:hypothetical protein
MSDEGAKDTRQRISIVERADVLMEWLDGRQGHVVGKRRFEILDTLTKVFDDRYPYARNGAHSVSKTISHCEEQGWVKVERSPANTVTEITHIKVKPEPTPIVNMTRDMHGNLVPISSSSSGVTYTMLGTPPAVDLTPVLTMLRSVAATLDDMARIHAQIREREAQVSKILGDMAQADARRHSAVMDKAAEHHAALAADRDLRQNYSVRLGLVERKLDAIMAKLDIKLRD